MTGYPAHYMPFPPVAPNPARGHCADRVWAWVDQSGIARDAGVRHLLRRADPELTTARYFPSAEPGLFVYLAQLMAWIFVNDDEFDDGHLGRDPARCEATVAARSAVLDGRAPEGVMERSLAELWARLPAGRSPAWHATFRQDMQSFLRTYAVEAAERASRRRPQLEAYLAHRRDTAGTRWCADLIEIAVAVDIPADVRQQPAYKALKDAAATHCGLVNDIHSAGKEVATGQIHNAVCLLMHHEGQSLDEAIQTVNDMATDCVHAFNEAARSLPASDGITGWVTGVRQLVRGNVDWHFESERYRGDLAAMKESS